MQKNHEIEYFYSAHSAYAYLGAWELDRIAQATNSVVIHRPFDFLPVIDAAGAPGFADRSKAHIDYFFGRDMRRWAEWRGLDMISHRPTYHDAPLQLANGMIIAATHKRDALSRAILRSHWRDDADISDSGTLTALGNSLGLDGAALVAAAQSDGVQAQHAKNTQDAIDRSVFGSPTYFVGGDMFYGQDRLEMVARALRTPFASDP